MKKILIAIPLLLIIIILAVGFSLNTIIKRGIETIGPIATGTTISLQKADISLFTGKGQLKNLLIGNPEGFKTDYAFRLNEIRIALDVKSIFSDKIIINEIYINAPDITYEKGGKGDNIKTILANVRSLAGSSGGTSKGKQVKAEAGKDKKIQIGLFTLKNGKVNISVAALNGETISTDLPDITLRNIGKDKDGTTMAKVMEQVLAEVNTNILTSVAGPLKDIGKTIGRTMEKTVGGAIKGLFGK
ncbi:MAG: hypothetical protein ISR96_08080 [Nitrospira sp.]|nr:hypothetical protein [bacterium]MBL7049455.1 hypothetical protein [Nitrospira sp.]